MTWLWGLCDHGTPLGGLFLSLGGPQKAIPELMGGPYIALGPTRLQTPTWPFWSYRIYLLENSKDRSLDIPEPSLIIWDTTSGSDSNKHISENSLVLQQIQPCAGWKKGKTPPCPTSKIFLKEKKQKEKKRKKKKRKWLHPFLFFRVKSFMCLYVTFQFFLSHHSRTQCYLIGEYKTITRRASIFRPVPLKGTPIGETKCLTELLRMPRILSFW